MLLCLQSANLAADDPTNSYMLSAGARICKCLGQEFLPYLSIVMPPLLQSAQLKPDVEVRANSEESEEDEDDDEVGCGDMTHTIFMLRFADDSERFGFHQILHRFLSP